VVRLPFRAATRLRRIDATPISLNTRCMQNGSDLATSEGPAAAQTKGGGRPGRWLKRLGWAVGAVVFLGAASWALVPPILKSQLEKLASTQMGRQFTVGKIDFKPWTLELTLEDMALAKADGSASQIQVKRLYANASMQSLRQLAPVLDALQIDGLSAQLTHLGQGQYDIDDILKRLARPAAKPADPNAPPPGFALFNVALNGASLDFTDKTVAKTHELRNLNLSVPFLSNLDADREVKTEPRLAFRFNGSAFDSQAASTPFKASHKTDAAIKVGGLDLKPYLAYLPASLPVRLTSAVLDADLKLAFEQTPRTSVKLSGTVQAKGVAVQDTAKQDLLAFDSLKLALDELRPLEQSVKLSLVELQAPKLEVRRDKAGRLNLAFQNGGTPKVQADPQAPAKPKAEADNKPSSGADTAPATKPATAGATANNADKATSWRVDVAKIALNGGWVHFSDDTTQPPVRLAMQDLQLGAESLAWQFTKAMPFKGSAQLALASSPSARSAAPAASAAPSTAASLKFDGNATDQAAQVNADLSNLSLALGAPYLAQFLEPQLTGVLSTALALDWKPDGLKLAAKQVTVNNLALGGPPARAVATNKATKPVAGKLADAAPAAGTLASLKKVEVLDLQLDLTQQAVVVGKVALLQAAANVERDTNQHWMFERWFKSTAGGAAGGGASKGAGAGAAPVAKPWAVSVKDMQLDGGAFKFVDKGVAKPVEVDVSAVKASLKGFSLDAKKPFPLTLAFKLKQPQGEPGQLDYKGDLGLAPVSAQGNLTATQIPVHAFEPYFGGALNIELLRADVGFKGAVKFASGVNGATVKVTGDSVLEEFRAHTLAGVAAAPAPAGAIAQPGGLKISEELLTWKALSLRGLDVALAPGVATTVSVAETALTDFFARVLIDPTGRINLQDLVKTAGNPAQAASPTAAAGASGAPATGASAALPQVQVAATGPEAVINIGPVSLINGKVFFSDQFIRPNYSANLSELNGRLSAFSSVAAQGGPQMADLELRGRAEGTAALEILGQLNPLAKPLALDIKAKVRDLELPPLSPYSVKYAGHGIERGKLSVDLAYVVLPSGQLEAKNKIILNQLKFGDKVDGAPASLPVRLAVALLADRNGVIDLDLPVSGSLNDPQFRLAPIIFKIIGNIIVKAITAPFSLLAAAFGGGGDELSQVSFAPGSAVLAADAKVGLDKVAKALLDRPALKMTVVGLSSLEEEREGYKRERLRALLQAEKRRAQVVAGTSGGASAGPGGALALPAQSAASAPAATAPVDTVVSESETPALLKEVFKRSDIPKPRNALGIAKDLPTEEMQALLLANIVVTQDAMRELALQRGVAVKDYLASKHLPVERLFLGSTNAGGAESKPAGTEAKPAGAENTQAASEGKAATAPGKWTPRAELNLATN
jgi:Domain of Unknown Function (DUF748)